MVIITFTQQTKGEETSKIDGCNKKHDDCISAALWE